MVPLNPIAESGLTCGDSDEVSMSEDEDSSDSSDSDDVNPTAPPPQPTRAKRGASPMDAQCVMPTVSQVLTNCAVRSEPKKQRVSHADDDLECAA